MALELGPCAVFFGASGSEVDLGKTNGGVTLRITDDTVDLKSDQFGSAAEDSIITGTNVEVETALAEVGLSSLAFALGQTALGSTPSVIAGLNKVGTSMKGTGKQLILKKFVNGAVSADAKDWIYVPTAAPVSNVELGFDAENQRVLKVMFKGYPTTVTASWASTGVSAKVVTYFFGDSSVTN